MSTGIRLSELADLHCQSVTGEPGICQLDVAGKGAKYRAIPAMEGLVDHINTYQAERKDRFPNHLLDRRTTPLFVHALRHTFAMDLLDHGASIVEVQALLGHESVATTRRYFTARPHELRNAVAATGTATMLRRNRSKGSDG